MSDFAARVRAERKARQAANGFLIDVTQPGSSEVAQQARNLRDSALRTRFVTAPWRGSDGKLHGGHHDDYSSVSPELGSQYSTARKPWVDPTDPVALAEDRKLAERESKKWGSKDSDTPRFVEESSPVKEGSQADYAQRMKARLDAQMIKDREQREQEQADAAERAESDAYVAALNAEMDADEAGEDD